MDEAIFARSAGTFCRELDHVACRRVRLLEVSAAEGIQFTFPPRYGDRPTAIDMTHMLDMRCRESGIEHRLRKIRHPWTGIRVECMNRTIKEGASG